jgi:ketosteroid isomerase-like protein
MARRGYKAFLEAAAPDAAILLPQQTITPAKISEGMFAHRYGGRTTYRHEPAHAVASADGQFGCTLGLSRYASDSGKAPTAGIYATCWRRTRERWEIVAHYRNEGESTSARWTGPVPRSPTRFFTGLPDEWSRDAKAADSAFARLGLVGESPAPAFAAYVADDGIVMTTDTIFQGAEGMRGLFTGFPKDRVLLWDPHPDYGWASGGLAFTVGHSANAARLPGARSERLTKYFTIWRQDADGRWRFIFDAGSPRQ